MDFFYSLSLFYGVCGDMHKCEGGACREQPHLSFLGGCPLYVLRQELALACSLLIQ